MCPNCHSQTDTYAGKNVKSKRKVMPKIYQTKEKKQTRLDKRRKCKITKEELNELVNVKKISNVKIATMLGVSETIIRRRKKEFKIT